MTPRPSVRHRPAGIAALAAVVTGGLLAVTGPAAEAGVSAPAHPGAIQINQATGPGQQAVDPYPASATMWGIDGPITDVNVDLNNLTFGIPQDIDILLVSPEGTAMLLVGGACGTQPVVRAFWTIDDQAAQPLPASGGCGSGSYRPTSGSFEHFPPPAPLPDSTQPAYARTLAAFRGENPNGTWRLYVADDDQSNPPSPADHGVILGGFRLIISTQTRAVVVPADADGGGPASTYPVVRTISGQNGRIDEMFVYVEQLSHGYPDDLDVLLVAPAGQKVMLMSDACGGTAIPNGLTFRFNDRDPVMPDEGRCGPGGAGVNFAPTDRQPGESLPAPAPPGPYATSLSSLRGTNPNGEWRLYVADDLNNHSGYLQGFSVSFDLAPPADFPPPPPQADTTAPNTRITQRPPTRTRSRKARFAFTATEAQTRFDCRVDARPWRRCTSPKAYSRLHRGRHVFLVRATDRAGNRDRTPATWTWRIRR